jgi:hypothetical protein
VLIYCWTGNLKADMRGRINDYFTVYNLGLPGQDRDVVAIVSPDVALTEGLPSAAIVGQLLTPRNRGGQLEAANFAVNPTFVDFLHRFVAERVPQEEGFVQAAARQGTGNIFVIDLRTPTPEGPVPPHDIIGYFRIEGGKVVVSSYAANAARHRILSEAGFFRLNPLLMDRLRDDLQKTDKT